jgi:hypothetical protein
MVSTHIAFASMTVTNIATNIFALPAAAAAAALAIAGVAAPRASALTPCGAERPFVRYTAHLRGRDASALAHVWLVRPGPLDPYGAVCIGTSRRHGLRLTPACTRVPCRTVPERRWSWGELRLGRRSLLRVNGDRFPLFTGGVAITLARGQSLGLFERRQSRIALDVWAAGTRGKGKPTVSGTLK